MIIVKWNYGFIINGFPTISKYHKIIVSLFIIWLGVAISFALTIPPLTTSEKFFPDDHPVSVAQDWIDNKYIQTNQGSFVTKIDFVWGLDYLDQSNYKFYGQESFGVPIFDNNLDLSPVANQQYLYDTCEALKTYELTLHDTIDCFMYDYKTYRENTLGLSFPADFSTNANTQKVEFEADLYNFTQNEGYIYSITNQINFNSDNELVFFTVTTPTSTRLFDPKSQKKPVYDKYELKVAEINNAAPTGLDKSYQSGGVSWAWMASEAGFRILAVNGMSMAAAFAFIALLISTKNLIISLCASLNIAGIVASVSAAIKIAGWPMGITESVALVILVGFSVDYVVHLANAYIEANHVYDRHTRVQLSLREMGATVLAGAITSFGSSVFMWAATSTFFVKFAALLAFTVSFSISWSLIFFPSLCYLCGPQGNDWNIDFKSLFNNDKAK